MPTAYQKTDELDELIAELIDENYKDDLKAAGLTVDVLFATPEEDEPLMSGGRACYAYIKATGLKERALGQADVTLVIDSPRWEKLNEQTRRALVDHELYHPVVKKDKFGAFKFDDLHRPKVGMRKHDVEVGWFVEIAKRHGDFSIERIQATAMLTKHRQDLFGIQMELPGFTVVES